MSTSRCIGHRDTGFVRSESALSAAFGGAIGHRRWTPRGDFGSSDTLGGRVFSFNNGVYLRSNPNHGEGDPVFAVCWAESDYWAQRAWTYPHFAGDLTPPPPQYDGPPSLASVGKPNDLSFGSVLGFERAQPGALVATLTVATYRITDGAFMHSDIRGSGRVTYCYGSTDPKTLDLPVAIEVRLSLD